MYRPQTHIPTQFPCTSLHMPTLEQQVLDTNRVRVKKEERTWKETGKGPGKERLGIVYCEQTSKQFFCTYLSGDRKSVV